MTTMLNKMQLVCAGIAISAATLFSSAASAEDDRHVKLINETRHTMVRFYASAIGKDSWEEDILGEKVLKVGQSVKVNIDDGSGSCLYDFKAVFDDGDSMIRNRINVCKVGEYRYTEE